MKSLNLDKLEKKIENVNVTRNFGHIARVVGLVIESQGPEVSIGELCYIESEQKEVKAEVVGFDENRVILMPIGDMEGITPGARVIATGSKLKVKVGESLLGQVMNGTGEPMLGKGDLLSDLKE